MVDEIEMEIKVKVEKHYINEISNNGVSIQSDCSLVCIHMFHIDKRCIFLV